MKRKSDVKILHLSRETLKDLASALTGGDLSGHQTCGAVSVTACPQHKVCD